MGLKDEIPVLMEKFSWVKLIKFAFFIFCALILSCVVKWHSPNEAKWPPKI